MLLDQFSVIVIALLFLAVLCLAAFQTVVMFKQSQSQEKLIRNLANLAASKDIQTYHGLEMPGGPLTPLEEHYAMDDESLARRLGEKYSESGRDPSLALSEDSDPLADFGGKSAFL